MEINKRLKALRLRNGYSKLYVSKRLGYKSNTVVRKEKGQREWSIQDIRKLCDLYNISPAYLLSDDEITGGTGNENISKSDKQ
ncbi:helix-turn-helix domain-containing protein [Clostridioides difficile]